MWVPSDINDLGLGVFAFVFCCFNKHHDQKQTGEERVSFGFFLHGPVHHWGNRTELKAGTRWQECGAETVETCCLLTCFLFSAQPACYTVPDQHLPRDSSTHGGLSCAPLIIRQCSTDMATGQSDLRNPLIETSSIDPGLCQVGSHLTRTRKLSFLQCMALTPLSSSRWL